MGRRAFSLDVAQEAARDLCQLLYTVCGRIEVVGSVRRERARVCDLDLLVLPKSGMMDRLQALSFIEVVHLREVTPGHQGPTQIRLVHCQTGVPVDLHCSPSMETWWTRLVVLTGSRQFVSALQATARAKFRSLGPEGVADERGMVRHPKSERAVFQSIGHRYEVPSKR